MRPPTEIALIGTCHTCRLRGMPDCKQARRSQRSPDLGCTGWKSGVRGQIVLELERWL